MVINGETSRNGHHEFTVFLGSQQFLFESFENALDALDRVGIIREDGIARDVLERRAMPVCAELVETWP